MAEPDARSTQHDAAALRREFVRFARYLAGVEPTPYQVEKYVACHSIRPFVIRGQFDALLLRLALGSGVGLRLADAYSGTLHRSSVVRGKLILTIAVLESAAPTFAALDRADGAGVWTWLRLGARGVVAVATVFCAALLLGPAHVLSGRGASDPARP